MRKVAEQCKRCLPTVLMALGAIAVSVGVGMICRPAGVITAGVLAVVGGVLMMMGQEERHNE